MIKFWPLKKNIDKKIDQRPEKIWLDSVLNLLRKKKSLDKQIEGKSRRQDTHK